MSRNDRAVVDPRGRPCWRTCFVWGPFARFAGPLPQCSLFFIETNTEVLEWTTGRIERAPKEEAGAPSCFRAEKAAAFFKRRDCLVPEQKRNDAPLPRRPGVPWGGGTFVLRFWASGAHSPFHVKKGCRESSNLFFRDFSLPAIATFFEELYSRWGFSNLVTMFSFRKHWDPRPTPKTEPPWGARPRTRESHFFS
ncbi:hypothetical protein GWK47_001624 [Chionoecetes opilio]|uniref:Uncharacterized protein n=1 Tax=Chionoecetes opilio TaxID=41210 RepID=A0A8J4XTA0_CHIOP|nr:hypothetical protein GWK47_001624 [Chionoecetes opilio]